MTQLSKEHFEKLIGRLAGKDELHDLDFRLRDILAVTSRRFDSIDTGLGVVDKQLGTINERLDQHDAKLDAILTAVATRQEMRNLVHELNARGIELDETKIFLGGA